MKPPVVRQLAIRHTKFVCLTASFLATGGFVKLFHKIPWFFHDYSFFFNSMIFPCMEPFYVIFQSLWETWILYIPLFTTPNDNFEYSYPVNIVLNSFHISGNFSCLLITFVKSFGPRLSGHIWINTVWHSDGFADIIFRKNKSKTVFCGFWSLVPWFNLTEIRKHHQV